MKYNALNVKSLINNTLNKLTPYNLRLFKVNIESIDTCIHTHNEK